MRNGDAQNLSDQPAEPLPADPSGLTNSGRGDTAPSRYASGDWIGRTIGKYRIVGLLGRGGMGLVYRAHDESLSRDVALKLLPAELADDANVRDRFLSEAKSAAQVAHGNVVSIFDVGRQEQTCFIAMELVTGGNVEDNAPAGGAYRPMEATRIIIDACRGLAAAHKTGLVHRDIKPSNLLRTGDGNVKLADFGLAKGHQAQQQALTRTGQVVGTPYYMSPEQCQSQPVNHLSDVYSLGATYFTLLTGRRPYADVQSDLQVMYAHCHGVVLDPRLIDPQVPDACAQVVMRATAKKKEDRFQSAAEMLAALESTQLRLNDSASSETVIVPSSVGAGEPDAARWRRRSFLLAGSAAALGAVYGGWKFFQRDDDARLDGPDAADGDFFRGVTRDSITFGTTTAYSGANQDLGRNMVLGIRTCFEAVNAEGGINGRQLKLIVLDDGYEPGRAIANMYELFDEHQVFGVIGNVGTPTALVTVPYAVENRYLYFAPFTGARFLRKDPPERYVYNYRAGYADETAAIARHFVEIREIPADRIAVFAQNDSFGDEGFDGVTRALRTYGVRADDVLRVSYDRNSIDISNAVETLAANRERVQAVVMVATYKPAAHFVKEIKDRGGEMLFAALSFVGSEAMSEEFLEIGPAYADGVIVTQVVPFFQSSATGVIRYRDMLHRFYPEAHPGFVSLEGFIAAQCLVEGLKRVRGELTTETLIDTLDSIHDLDLGIGPIVNFGPSRHQVSDHVWGTVLDASAAFHPLDLEQP